MKYTTEIKINVPLEELTNTIDTIDNLKHWQRGLISAEHVSGDPGQLGAKMQLTYQWGSRKMKIIETITKRNFPKEFHANYTSNSMLNVQENYFKKTSEGFSQWTSINEYLPLTFSMRLMLWIMPNAFKKQSKTNMQDLKNFVENGTSVAHA